MKYQDDFLLKSSMDENWGGHREGAGRPKKVRFTPADLQEIEKALEAYQGLLNQGLFPSNQKDQAQKLIKLVHRVRTSGKF